MRLHYNAKNARKCLAEWTDGDQFFIFVTECHPI